MTSESNVCAYLLDRLKKLQETQVQCRLKSEAYLSSLLSDSASEQSPRLQPGEKEGLFTSSGNDENLKASISSLNSDCILPSHGIALKMQVANTNLSPLDSISNTLDLTKEQIGRNNQNYDTLNFGYPKDQTNVSNHQEEEVQPEANSIEDLDQLKPVRKFPYLKKGEGTCRFKTNKKLKRFRRHNETKDFKKPSDLKFPKSVIITENRRKKGSKKFDKFEKLEELVEQDSFCSTSSKVAELLQDDSANCSTPVSTRSSFMASLEITPFRKQNQMSDRGFEQTKTVPLSPVRKLFPSNLQSCIDKQASLLSSVQNGNFLNIMNSSNGRYKTESLSLKNSSGGILKKKPESCISPSYYRVKFQEQGAEFLEYQEPAEETDLAACDDSDLISISDLENLALLNFKVNVFHEDSFEEFVVAGNKAAASQDGNLTSKNVCIANVKELPSNAFNNKSTSFMSQTLRHTPDGTDQKCQSIQNIVSTLHSSQYLEDLDTKSHKILLLSKVEDLQKEIRIFKSKNNQVEKLISELEIEKQKLVQLQKEKNLAQVNVKRVNTVKPPKKLTEKIHKQQTSDLICKKLEEMSEKLRRLEIENSNLKRKVLKLQRREKEIENNQSKKGNADAGIVLLNETNKPKLKSKAVSMGRSNKTVRFCTKIPAKALSNITNANTCATVLKYSPTQEEKVKMGNVHETKHKCSDTVHEAAKVDSGIGGKIQEKHLSLEIHKENKDLTSKFHRHSPTLNPYDLQSYNAPDAETSNTFDKMPSLCKDASSKTFDSYERSNPVAQSSEFTKFTAPVNEDLEVIDIFPTKGFSDNKKKHFENYLEQPCDDSFVGEDTRTIQYSNGDQKTISSDKVVYYYAEDGTTHTIFFHEGKEEIKFGNGQKEIYFKDGSYQIIFADSSSKSVYKDGSEICVWKDGTVIRTNRNAKTVHFPNGQKEIYEDGNIRRVYPDGTIKILYPDGRQETRYKNGRIRVKDSEGNIVMNEVIQGNF